MNRKPVSPQSLGPLEPLELVWISLSDSDQWIVTFRLDKDQYFYVRMYWAF